MIDQSKENYEVADTVFVRDVENRVFQAIAFKCLMGIEGVELVGSNLLDSLLGRDSQERIKGIHVEQDQKNHSVHIKIELNVAYGVAIPDKAEEIQSKVAKEICRLTGLHVSFVHIVFKNLISAEVLGEEVSSEEENAISVSEYADDF
jgi:uncharacterized alkaline shock family protein YloU